MKPLPKFTVQRTGQKKYEVSIDRIEDFSGKIIRSGCHSSFNGSYLKMTEEETLQDVFRTILYGLGYDQYSDFDVKVIRKEKKED